MAAKAKQKSYLVATFDGFPGVRIPLLSDEECREHGIEPGRFPPFSTWTPAQQEAGRKFADIMGEMAISQAYRSMLAELEQMITEGYEKEDCEVEAARRIKSRIEAKKWKPPAREDTFGLQREVGWVLDLIVKQGGILSVPACGKPGMRRTRNSETQKHAQHPARRDD